MILCQVCHPMLCGMSRRGLLGEVRVGSRLTQTRDRERLAEKAAHQFYWLLGEGVQDCPAENFARPNGPAGFLGRAVTQLMTPTLAACKNSSSWQSVQTPPQPRRRFELSYEELTKRSETSRVLSYSSAPAVAQNCSRLVSHKYGYNEHIYRRGSQGREH
jgi:hypothetical protein